MRILRISLVTLLLGPLGACMVNARGGAGTIAPPPPGEPNASQLSGTVIDAATHQPIAQVAVDITTLDHRNKVSGHTDASGHYTTPPVPPGEYEVGVRRNGYRAMSKPNFEMRPGMATLDIALDPTGPGGPH